MKIESSDNDIILFGSFIGTRFSEEDQATIIKWFIQNKPGLVRRCKKELREQRQIITSANESGIPQDEAIVL